MQEQIRESELDRWEDTPTRSPLPAHHPLAVLTEAALTPAGLTDRQWIAIAPAELRELARPIRQARRAYRRLQAPTTADINTIRTETLATLSRLVADDQKRPGAPLWQVLSDRLAAPPRPATGARDFRKALAEKQPRDRDRGQRR